MVLKFLTLETQPRKGTETVENDFRKYTTDKVTELFNVLRKETLEIESNIAIGEKEVLDRDKHAFMMRRHELALAYVLSLLTLDASSSRCRFTKAKGLP